MDFVYCLDATRKSLSRTSVQSHLAVDSCIEFCQLTFLLEHFVQFLEAWKAIARSLHSSKLLQLDTMGVLQVLSIGSPEQIDRTVNRSARVSPPRIPAMRTGNYGICRQGPAPSHVRDRKSVEVGQRRCMNPGKE